MASSAVDRCAEATTILLRYTRRSGRWVTPTGEGWQPALAIEALLDAHLVSGEPSYLTFVERSFARYRYRRSRFYDDDGWYLNAWLRAYRVTGERAYLDEAVSLFSRLTGAWDETCRGGVWWTQDRTYKNAITNELFVLSAARLHQVIPNSGYLDWAVRAWQWFSASSMINNGQLVNDGLDGNCANNGQTTWTYNQGVILSALVELHRATGDNRYLEPAHRIAAAAIRTLVNRVGILTEPGEPDRCDGNQLVFKGIFTQGLARLYDSGRLAGAEYGSFLTTNADRLWHTGRDRLGRFGLTWSSRSDRYNAATHISGCLLIGSVALLAAPTRAVW
jgi:predicted alpha-1,6-mannanase (GH76 family)